MASKRKQAGKVPAPASAPEPPTEEAKKPKEKKEKKRYFRHETVFYAFFGLGLVSALYAPIQDTDEVFNYWEPVHFLTHGSGRQTWENTPLHALRSWTFSLLNASAAIAGRHLPWIHTKVGQFYFVRIVLAFVHACAQTHLAFAIARAFADGVHIAIFYVVASLSAGYFHAITALLPNTFSMTCTIVAVAELIEPWSESAFGRGLFAMAVGCTIGWPFSAVMVAPFVLNRLLWTVQTRQARAFAVQMVEVAAKTGLLIGLQSVIDSAFYGKIVAVPWNLVWYNKGANPNLFGTEPWFFYLQNLSLNFSLWFPLALAALPLLLISGRLTRPTFTATLPLYLWLGIMSALPHKEERFMFPAYPFVALNAALGIDLLVKLAVVAPAPLTLVPLPIRVGLVATLALLSSTLNLSRAVRLWSAYSAPMDVYLPLHEPDVFTASPGRDSVLCIGKEWHRFPSSFFLPEGMRLGIVESEFAGLVPGQFSDTTGQTGWAAARAPRNMNNRNEEDKSHYTPLSQCSYLVDSYLPSTVPTEKEPVFAADPAWETVKCAPFLDSKLTTIWHRTLAIPTLIPLTNEREVWGVHCLLKSKHYQAKHADAAE